MLGSVAAIGGLVGVERSDDFNHGGVAVIWAQGDAFGDHVGEGAADFWVGCVCVHGACGDAPAVGLREFADEELVHRYAEAIDVASGIERRALGDLLRGRISLSAKGVGVDLIVGGNDFGQAIVHEHHGTVLVHDVLRLNVTVDDGAGVDVRREGVEVVEDGGYLHHLGYDELLAEPAFFGAVGCIGEVVAADVVHEDGVLATRLVGTVSHVEDARNTGVGEGLHEARFALEAINGDFASAFRVGDGSCNLFEDDELAVLRVGNSVHLAKSAVVEYGADDVAVPFAEG